MSVSTLSIKHGRRCSVSLLLRHSCTSSTSTFNSLTYSELINIFEIFLPQLLRYPNPADPLNGEAAALLMRDPKAYAKKVESYVERFATPADADDAGDGDEDEDEDRMGGPGSYKAKKRLEANGHSGAATTNGNKSTTNGNGNGVSNGQKSNGDGDGDEEDEDEDEDDKMSDMGELSDGDEFMGEMDD